jgi:hypothetical protein
MANVTGIEVESLLSSRTEEPVVQLRIRFDNNEGQTVVQMSPEQAREVAHHILEAAEASIVDAFLYDWLQKVLKAHTGQAALLMSNFRVFREARVATNTEQPVSEPETKEESNGH